MLGLILIFVIALSGLASFHDGREKLIGESLWPSLRYLLLDQLGRYEETKVLVFEATSKLESRNRELALFYCILLEAHSKRGSPKGFLSIWLVVCVQMNRSREAEDLVEDLRGNSGAINPSAFELKSIMYGYGSEVGVVP
ncbi:hypothetical protein HN51_041499 [Arachis hypogaea]